MNRICKRIFALIIVLTVFLSFHMTAFAAESNTDVMNREMLLKINDLRAEYNLSALTEDPELSTYAQIRAEEITTNFSHTRPDGTQGYDIIPLTRSYAGENLSYFSMEDGVETAAEQTFAALVNSPTHLENMVASEYTKIGIASVEANGRMYVAYLFSN